MVTTVKRIFVRSAWDSPRNFIASNALAEGFDELVWIDPDVGFVADDVDRVRSHGLPFVVGLVAEPGRREFRCEFLPQTSNVTFGANAKPLAVRYAGLSFALVHKEIFDVTARQFDLSPCNAHLGLAFRTWFLPLVTQEDANQR